MSNEQNMKPTFITNSILDMQATIRAIDFKGYVVLLLLSLPFSKIEVFSEPLRALCVTKSWAQVPAIVLVATVVGFWLVTLALAMRCLIVVVNPSDRVAKEKKTEPPTYDATGIFFAAHRFRYTVHDALLGDSRVQTPLSPSALVRALPDDKGLLEELAFEQLKIGFILARKIACTRFAMISTLVWALAGVVLWVVSILHRAWP